VPFRFGDGAGFRRTVWWSALPIKSFDRAMRCGRNEISGIDVQPRRLLPIQHSEPKNRVKALRAVERPHSQLPLRSSGDAYAQDLIGRRTNSLDDCCSDKFEGRCCWRGIRRWDWACGRWACRRCRRRRCRRNLGETFLGTAE
jgi:hypothetical protein